MEAILLSEVKVTFREATGRYVQDDRTPNNNNNNNNNNSSSNNSNNSNK
jgi:hypothetical protein